MTTALPHVGPNPVIDLVMAGHVMHATGKRPKSSKAEGGVIDIVDSTICPVCVEKYPCSAILQARLAASSRARQMTRDQAIARGRLAPI